MVELFSIKEIVPVKTADSWICGFSIEKGGHRCRRYKQYLHYYLQIQELDVSLYNTWIHLHHVPVRLQRYL